MDYTKITSNPIYDDVSSITHDSIIKKFIPDLQRYYLHTMPNKPAKVSLILFYHGSRDIAWAQILNYTGLADQSDYIVAFGQASGQINKPVIHEYYKYASFGELYWEIRDGNPPV